MTMTSASIPRLHVLGDQVGSRPMATGLLLTPIYLVMMVGSPLSGKLADRIGSTCPILGGLFLYADAARDRRGGTT